MTWYDPHSGSSNKSIQSVSDADDLCEYETSKSWLEVLPSCSGTVLAAILANIMTQGLTPNQENILGNFISSVGSLISYKASRDDTE